jgi:hypothetical protein
MDVLLPILADVRVDDRRAARQCHTGNALVRLLVPLNVVPLAPLQFQPSRIPSRDLHPQDILCFEGLGVLEDGIFLLILALRLLVLTLSILTALPASRVKAAKRKRRTMKAARN